MKRFLPILVISSLLIVVGSIVSPHVFADTTTIGSITPPDNTWVEDAEVTFVGKMAARADSFINWMLQNHDWIAFSSGSNPLAPLWRTILGIVVVFFSLFVLITAFLLVITRGRSITLMQFLPRFIIVVLLIFFSFALVQFLYQTTDIVQGFFLKNPAYDSSAPSSDALRSREKISSANLLNIGFKYETFKGYRLSGAQNDEAAFVSLLLVRLTAFTYYVMGGLLLLRKIILWFFLIVSPVFPLLILYAPIRNTAKIWVGEFFRWLLFAPIFAIFLSGLVALWRARVFGDFSIPLQFSTQPTPSQQDIANYIAGGALPPGYIYPTAINILLGGPGQHVAIGNSLNYPDTFIQYVVALIMVWVVIFLPFLLLQIFLDYFRSVTLLENSFFKQLLKSGPTVLPHTPAPAAPSSPIPSGSAGISRQMPFMGKVTVPEISSSMAKQIPSGQTSSVSSTRIQEIDRQILQRSNLSIPTIRDIARIETTNLSSKESKETIRIKETLQKIASPATLASTIERERFSLIKHDLVKQSAQGSVVATSLLSAASLSAPSTVYAAQDVVSSREFLAKLANPGNIETPIERVKFTALRNDLVYKQQQGNPLASSIIKTADSSVSEGLDSQSTQRLQEQISQAQEKQDPIVSSLISAATLVSSKTHAVPKELPAVNRIQEVSLDDYEAVKKMWTENYQNLEPPKTVGEESKSREKWITEDIERISQTISLLSSSDSQKVKEGMDKVSQILPFLLIGGFSQTEVIAYLKAKLEAAKGVHQELQKKTEEEETLLPREQKSMQEEKHQEAQQEISVDEMNKTISDINTQGSLGDTSPKDRS